MFMSRLGLFLDLWITVYNRLWGKFIGECLRDQPHESMSKAGWGRGRDELQCSVTRPQLTPQELWSQDGPSELSQEEARGQNPCILIWTNPGIRLPPGRVCNLGSGSPLAPGKGQLQRHFRQMEE